MQFLLMIYGEEQRWARMGQAEQTAEAGEYRALGQQFAASIQGGNALQPTMTAKTVRVLDGKRTVTDGPFAETKEQLGGYYLVDVKDVDEAIAIAAKIPAARAGCVEVRPIMKFS